MTDTDKDRAYLLLEISKMHRERFNTRRSYQWKVNLALWSALGLLSGTIASKGITLPIAPIGWALGGVIVALVLASYVYWQGRLAWHNANDRTQAKNVLTQCEGIVEAKTNGYDTSETEVDSKRKGWKFRFDYSHFFQTVITAALLAFLAAAVCFGSIATSKDKSAPSQVLELKYTTSQPSKSITGEIRN